MTDYYLTKGDIEKAKEFHAKAEKLEPTRPWVMWVRGVIAAREGNRETALLMIKMIEDAKMGPISFNYIAYVYYALGDLDSFFELMNKVIETHALIPLFLMHSPLFAQARIDPRYSVLVRKVREHVGITK